MDDEANKYKKYHGKNDTSLSAEAVESNNVHLEYRAQCQYDLFDRRKNGWLTNFLGPRQPFVRIGKLGLGLLSPFRVISNSGTAQRDHQDVGWLRCGVAEDPLVRLIGFIVSLRQGSLMTLVRWDQHSNRPSDAY
ncbi:hypothetical protein LB505_008539 [Fusarium chuoi]|nr:hypothetical protein LB505_008539 [Fusarium chuoi]